MTNSIRPNPVKPWVARATQPALRAALVLFHLPSRSATQPAQRAALVLFKLRTERRQPLESITTAPGKPLNCEGDRPCWQSPTGGGEKPWLCVLSRSLVPMIVVALRMRLSGPQSGSIRLNQSESNQFQSVPAGSRITFHASCCGSRALLAKCCG